MRTVNALKIRRNTLANNGKKNERIVAKLDREIRRKENANG